MDGWRRGDKTRPPCYGDFVEIFWDLQPDVPVDVEHPSILARILIHGHLTAVRTLLTFERIERELPHLEHLPAYARKFWEEVVEQRRGLDELEEVPGDDPSRAFRERPVRHPPSQELLERLERKGEPLRYGELPELFAEYDPDALIDVEQPAVLAKILTEAHLPVIHFLVTRSLLRRHLSTLPIPRHSRMFWEEVLKKMDERVAREADQS